MKISAELILNIGTLLGVIGVLYRTAMMTPKEATLSDANAMEKMSAVVSESLERCLKLNERINTLESNEIILKNQLKEKDKIISQLQDHVIELQSDVDKLTQQVKSSGLSKNSKKTGGF